MTSDIWVKHDYFCFRNHPFDYFMIYNFFSRMAASSEGKNERNFLELHRLVLDSTRVLRAKFDSFVPSGKTLQAWLPSDKDLKKAKLTDKQIGHIKQHNKSEMFDISVLTSLLRNFCYKADLKHPLWDENDNNKIAPSLTGEIADIVRIRNLRNEVCMICKHLMSDIHCRCTCYSRVTIC